MEYFHTLPQHQQNILLAAHTLALTCHYEPEHTQAVAYYALTLFDALRPLHPYGEQEKFWLYMASFLHDIGWVDGKVNHHKTSLNIILKSPILPLDNKGRLIIGSVARYHRKAFPNLSHDHYAALEPEEREMVLVLASILRFADGLDHLRPTIINNIHVDFSPKKITVTCGSDVPPPDKNKSIEKADLFEIVFNRKLKIRWVSPV